ncbi:hypothetical protein GCM10011512_28710 [Tersicoccus solisilvae]|uniref:Uncharacterized protein n=1 Tax=Tersicoccus solisilvae TaxID=1882339 RepID=A0ABQ1PNH8_9MICC|nr:hypothetical protein GCM10011512_28710 [Tersicoccus solisilvae]
MVAWIVSRTAGPAISPASTDSPVTDSRRAMDSCRPSAAETTAVGAAAGNSPAAGADADARADDDAPLDARLDPPAPVLAASAEAAPVPDAPAEAVVAPRPVARAPEVAPVAVEFTAAAPDDDDAVVAGGADSREAVFWPSQVATAATTRARTITTAATGHHGRRP